MNILVGAGHGYNNEHQGNLVIEKAWRPRRDGFAIDIEYRSLPMPEKTRYDVAAASQLKETGVTQSCQLRATIALRFAATGRYLPVTRL